MKRIFEFKVDGVGFSRNGTKAYLRGERPKFMFPEGALLEPTVPHHIELPNPRWSYPQYMTFRRLVMFYRDKNTSTSPETP